MTLCLDTITVRNWVLLLKRYVKFCAVGGTGVAVDMCAVWLMASTAMLEWNLSVSKVVASEVALINNFAWNELWTFREVGARTGWRERGVRFLKFNLICAAGIGFSVILLNVQVYVLGWNAYLANFIAIVVVSGWNFLLNFRYGWNAGETRQITEPTAAKRRR